MADSIVPPPTTAPKSSKVPDNVYVTRLCYNEEHDIFFDVVWEPKRLILDETLSPLAGNGKGRKDCAVLTQRPRRVVLAQQTPAWYFRNNLATGHDIPCRASTALVPDWPRLVRKSAVPGRVGKVSSTWGQRAGLYRER